MKVCSCGGTEFNKNRTTADGLQGICKNCQKKWQKKNKDRVAVNALRWRRKNKERAREISRNWARKNRGHIWAYHLKRVYQLDQEVFEKLIRFQGEKCGICQTSDPSDGRKKNWCVDHDHITGKIRGLLCHRCNVALSLFKESKIILMKGVDYLDKPPFEDLCAYQI